MMNMHHKKEDLEATMKRKKSKLALYQKARVAKQYNENQR